MYKLPNSRDPKHSDEDFDCDCPYCTGDCDWNDEDEDDLGFMGLYMPVVISRQAPEIEDILDSWF
jgi:hypothetical protein